MKNLYLRSQVYISQKLIMINFKNRRFCLFLYTMVYQFAALYIVVNDMESFLLYIYCIENWTILYSFMLRYTFWILIS